MRQTTAVALLLLAAASPCFAQLPTYGPLELRARTGTVEFGLPAASFIPAGERPHLNNGGDLAFHFDRTTSPITGIWLNGAPLPTVRLHDRPIRVALAEDGSLAWHAFARPPGGQFAPGFFRWMGAGPEEPLPIDATGNIDSFAYNQPGAVAFCRVAPGGAYASLLRWDPAGGLSTIAQGGHGVFDADFVAQNAAGQMAVLNTQGPEGGLRRYEPDGSSVRVNGPYSPGAIGRFDMNDHGEVAFRALASGHDLVRADGQTITVLFNSLAGDRPIGTINGAVAPAINNPGWVAFRATSSAGVEGIYVTDGQSLALVAAENDPIMTDAGPAHIWSFDSRGLDMNDSGDVAFIAELRRTEDNVVLHAGVILARAVPTCPADWNGDGDVNSSDISAFLTSWLASLTSGDLTADFDGSGAVNSSDISAFLTDWLASLGPGC